MIANEFNCIDIDMIYAACISRTSDAPDTYVKKLDLYDRVIFVDDVKSKYVCLYEDCNTLIDRNDLEGTESVVFEKTINPCINPRTYVCIKIGDKCREDLKRLENRI